jgi:hypothetical protein
MSIKSELCTLQAAPVLESGAMSRAVYLPGSGPWYDSQTGSLVKPDRSGRLSVPVTMDDVPSYLRGGYILPLRVGCPPMLSTIVERCRKQVTDLVFLYRAPLQPESTLGSLPLTKAHPSRLCM